MAKKANTTAVKKLQSEISKLKTQLVTTGNKLKLASKTLNEQKVAFKNELATKVTNAVTDAFSKARAEAEKKLSARDKVVTDSIDKFEKEWAKKYKLAPKAKTAKTSKTAKKATKKKSSSKKAKSAVKTAAVAE